MSNWIDPDELAVARARAWHWSDDAPVYRVQVNDPDLPDHALIACGQFVALTVELAGGLRGVRELQCEDPDAYLVFDPESEGGRLYLVCPEAVCREAARAFWKRRGAMLLGELAAQVGGAHVDDYPEILVQPIGPILQIQYWAKKYGHGQGADDGAVFFHDHEHTLPWLAVSEDGRLWYAGGDYDATDVRGIVG